MSTSAADEIWAILREVVQAQKETERRSQETERKSQETERMFQETERRFQESDRKFQELRQQMRESGQEVDRRIKEVTASIGRLGNRLGEFIEEAVRPAAVRLLRERDIDVHEVHENVCAQRGDEGLEIDLLAVNDGDVVAIECKSHLKTRDVDEHVERLGKLKRLLPTYAGKRVMGAVAALVIPDNVAQYAYRQGLFVIGQSGDHLVIRNDRRFVPATW